MSYDNRRGLAQLRSWRSSCRTTTPQMSYDNLSIPLRLEHEVVVRQRGQRLAKTLVSPYQMLRSGILLRAMTLGVKCGICRTKCQQNEKVAKRLTNFKTTFIETIEIRVSTYPSETRRSPELRTVLWAHRRAMRHGRPRCKGGASRPSAKNHEGFHTRCKRICGARSVPRPGGQKQRWRVTLLGPEIRQIEAREHTERVGSLAWPGAKEAKVPHDVHPSRGTADLAKRRCGVRSARWHLVYGCICMASTICSYRLPYICDMLFAIVYRSVLICTPQNKSPMKLLI